MKVVTLNRAAEISRREEAEILGLAAEGKIALAVHSPSWAALRGRINEDSGQFQPSDKSGALVLHDRWVYANPPYLRSLIESTDAVEMSFWRSRHDGPVDLFIARPNKPRIQRHHLHVRAEDLKALGSETELDSAESSDLDQRLAAMTRDTLTGGKPQLQISPRCELLRKGFLGRYQYRRVRVAGSAERYHEEPEKNEYSHPHDALQYVATRVFGEAVRGREDLRRRRLPLTELYPEYRKWLRQRIV